MPTSRTEVNIVTRNAAHLSMVELAIGSMAHALHVPFTGHILSLNQGAFLCNGCNHSSDRTSAALAAYEISGVAATFKSLSPTNKKLGPMLSIVMQGLLFSFGVIVLGRKKWGQMLGMVLLSLWAFIQPVMTLLVSFGPQQMDQVSRFYLERLNIDYAFAGQTFVSIIALLLLIKVIGALGLVVWMDRANETGWIEWQLRWMRRSRTLAPPVTGIPISPLRGSLRDLLSPLFLFSLILTGLFLLVQKESWSEFIWQSLRPVGVAFIIFYLSRSPTFIKLLKKLAERIGVLKPLHRRWAEVQKYLKND